MYTPKKLYLDPETMKLVGKYDKDAIVYVRADLPIYNGFRLPKAVVGINAQGEEKEWASVADCQKELMTTAVPACIKARCMCKGWALSYKEDFEK